MSHAAWAQAWATAVGIGYPDERERGPGRTLARRHHHEVEIEPGRARWQLAERRARTRVDDDPAGPDGDGRIATDLSVASIGAAAWDRLLDRLGEAPSLRSSVITGGWPPELAAQLAPTPSEMALTCTCDSWHDPCRHGWGLLTAIGLAIEADPQVLLVLRGRSRSELVGAVRHNAATERSGVAAGLAYGRSPGAPPRPLPLPWRSGRPVELGINPPPDSGVDLEDLAFLVRDAAARATALLSGGGDSGLYDTDDADLVRRAAEILRPGSLPPRADTWERLVTAAGISSDELEARARAWLIGGGPGLLAHLERVPAPADLVEAATEAIGGGRRLVDGAQLNGIQIRRSGDGGWWRFVADDRLGWLLVAGPFDDPAEAA